MGIRVKCQHCWKVFEAPDNALNKQHKCMFCQRMTEVQLLEGKDRPTKRVKSSLSEALFEKSKES